MRFTLLDRIIELNKGKDITAVRTLLPDEEYLKDHFPLFPVMPGVLMLEAMYQASAWLVRQSEGFKHSFVTLKEVRNVKYQGFVEPNQRLVVQAKILKHDEQTTTLQAQGTVDDRPAVTGRLVLEKYNLSDRDPSQVATDGYASQEFRKVFDRLMQN